MGDYLLLRGATYYFKRTVPTKLRSLIGDTVWCESLGARTRKEAVEAASVLIAATSSKIADAKRELLRQHGAAVMLTPAERALVEEHGGFAALRKHTAGTLALSTRMADASVSMLASLATPDGACATGETLDDLMVDLAEAEARVATLRQQVERNRAIVAKAGLKPIEALPGIAAEEPQLDLPGLAERRASLKHLPKQHADQYRYPARLFAEFHGSVPLGEITKAQIRDWRDALGRLPRSTNKAYRAATMRQAIARADRENALRITSQTVAKHLAAIQTLLRFAVGEGFIDRNPADGLTHAAPRGKKSATESKMPFTPAQARHLFGIIAAQHDPTRDEHWVPLVAIYQGMRQEEVCQLAVSDIRHDAAVDCWTVRITDAGEGQKVKNTSSVRTVPLHPALIARGFLEHVKRATGSRVFGTLRPDRRGRLGGPYGKAFARLLRTRAKITVASLTFHSFRHTWRDAARAAEVPAEVANALGGWSDTGNPVAAGYGSGVPIQVMVRWLAKVDPFA